MFHLLASAITTAVLTAAVQAPDAAAHAASCKSPHEPATILRSVAPETPLIARTANWTGTTVVRVDLSAAGGIVGTSVARSSGFAALDRAALETARAQTYAPETQDCRPVAGSYGVEVEFD
jgi:protein TonB